MITCYVGKYRRNIAITKDDYHKMIIIISGSKVVDIEEEEIVHCMGKKEGIPQGIPSNLSIFCMFYFFKVIVTVVVVVAPHLSSTTRETLHGTSFCNAVSALFFTTEK